MFSVHLLNVFTPILGYKLCSEKCFPVDQTGKSFLRIPWNYNLNTCFTIFTGWMCSTLRQVTSSSWDILDWIWTGTEDGILLHFFEWFEVCWGCVEVSLEVDLNAHSLLLLHFCDMLEVCWGSVEVSLEVDLNAHSLLLLHFCDRLEVCWGSVEVLLRSTSTLIHYSCYTSVTCLRSVEVLLRFLLRSTSTLIHYSCYTSLHGLRSVEVFGDAVFIILN